MAPTVRTVDSETLAKDAESPLGKYAEHLTYLRYLREADKRWAARARSWGQVIVTTGELVGEVASGTP
jgi:hypothetical protein